jgi:hypothetical protein
MITPQTRDIYKIVKYNNFSQGCWFKKAVMANAMPGIARNVWPRAWRIT